ncbi:hypothetical protein BCV72DRAFT_206630 [Rhizopus microsporus var. microsporus]|nr:hypothetical protein BCV72DRAFT_206630 [Rhizopus microsporus var. microsporus]
MITTHSLINYTRITTLVLSILIVITSLFKYNNSSMPVSTMLEPIKQGRDMVHDIIQDRRLIATLVASQASIFCPLFLLLNHSVALNLSSAVIIEQLFQCLMPIGLVISWYFCITFDQHIKLVIDLKDNWLDIAPKYVIVGVLVIEIILIVTASFKYFYIIYKEGAIQLPYEEEKECIPVYITDKV